MKPPIFSKLSKIAKIYINTADVGTPSKIQEFVKNLVFNFEQDHFEMMGTKQSTRLSLSEQAYLIAVHQGRTLCDSATFKMIDDHIFLMIAAHLERETFYPLDHPLITVSNDKRTATVQKSGFSTIFMTEELSIENDPHIEIKVTFEGYSGCYGIGFARPDFWKFSSFRVNEGNNGSVILWSDGVAFTSSGFKIIENNQIGLWNSKSENENHSSISCRINMELRRATIWSSENDGISPDARAVVQVPKTIRVIASFGNRYSQHGSPGMQSVVINGMYWVKDQNDK